MLCLKIQNGHRANKWTKINQTQTLNFKILSYQKLVEVVLKNFT